MYDHTAILPVEYVEAFERFIDSDVQVRAAPPFPLCKRPVPCAQPIVAVVRSLTPSALCLLAALLTPPLPVSPLVARTGPVGVRCVYAQAGSREGLVQRLDAILIELDDVRHYSLEVRALSTRMHGVVPESVLVMHFHWHAHAHTHMHTHTLSLSLTHTHRSTCWSC